MIALVERCCSLTTESTRENKIKFTEKYLREKSRQRRKFFFNFSDGKRRRVNWVSVECELSISLKGFAYRRRLQNSFLGRSLHKPKYFGWVQNIASHKDEMAIFLIHLRRIVLLSCVVYLFCDLVEDLMESVSCNYFIKKRKKFTIQAWIHIYYIYIYLMIVNNLSGIRRWDQVNLIEFLFSTSWRHKNNFSFFNSLSRFPIFSFSLPFECYSS